MKLVGSTKMDFAEELKEKTKKFAINIIHLYKRLPKNEEARIIGKQLIKAATSVAANYRAACRSRSNKEFYSKMSIVVEEADESVFWMEVLKESKIYEVENELMIEGIEILSIVSKSRKTAKNNLPN